MNRYNTTLISIDTESDLSGAQNVEIVFQQKGIPVLIKSGEDVVTDDHSVQTMLSSEETGLFEAGRYIPIKINAYYDDDTVVSSNVMYRPFNGTTKGAQ